MAEAVERISLRTRRLDTILPLSDTKFPFGPYNHLGLDCIYSIDSV